MTAMALVGAAFGASLFAVWLRILPPRPSPLFQLGRFDARAGSAPVRAAGDGEAMATRLGGWICAQLARRGIAATRLRQDLALTGASLPATMARKLAVGGVGLILGVVTAVALHRVGAVPVLGLLTAAGFSFLPDLDARRVAARRRREFRRALACYLDLVALEMAGAAAPAAALPNAAKVGAGWPLLLLRDELYRARCAGRDAWVALSELGERIGVEELRDLGSLVALLAHDGAQIRQTLSARAATMRRRELADAEGLAGQRDQSMRLAQLLIGFGFVVFLGYPAVVNVMHL